MRMQYSSSTSNRMSLSGLQLSPLLVAFIVLVHTPSTCQAWTNAPLLSSLHEGKKVTGESYNTLEQISQPPQLLLRWNKLKFTKRSRGDITITTRLFASNQNDDYAPWTNYQDNNKSNTNGNEDEASILEIADALTTATTIPLPETKVNGFVEKAQQAWTSPLNDTTSNRMSLTNGDNTPSTTNTNNNKNLIDTNTYQDEEDKYLTLAKEAWTEFFSEQLSQEEFLNMALDAWRDNAATLQQNDYGAVGSELVEVGLFDSVGTVEEQEVEINGNFDVKSGSQVDGTLVETEQVIRVDEEDNDYDETTATEQKWGINAAMSFLSGLFSGSKQQSSGSSADTTSLVIEETNEEDLPYGLRMKESLIAEENEEDDLPYGLRMNSPSVSILPPSSPSPAAMGGDNALSNDMGSMMKAKSLGKKQATPPISKGFTPPLKSFDKKQTMPTPSSIDKGVITSPMNKGVIKGKEKTSFGSGSKVSSTPPSFVNKGGSKLGNQGKVAPKKLDMVNKTGPQGSRGGLSFLKSDNLSKKFAPKTLDKADKKFNPMNKGVTIEKMKGLKIGQVGKSKGIKGVEAVSKVQVKAGTSKALPSDKKVYPPTKLISEGMTADEAELVRNRRLSADEVITLEDAPVAITDATKDKPIAITEGMTAEEAELARMARLEISDTMKRAIKTSTEKKEGAETMPLKTTQLNGPLSKTPGTPKVASGATLPKPSDKALLSLKKSPSFGIDSTPKKNIPPIPLKQPVAKKGFPPPPITMAAPSFSMEKKSLGLPPLPLKGKGEDSGSKQGMGMPPLAKKSFGDGNPTMKKAFPSAPLKMKGPMSKASGDDEASDDSSVPRGLPLKGGMSMGEKQAGLPGKGMPFMKKAPSFSMEKKSLGLPPLPLKGKGDDSGLKKGMGMPPLAKKSFGDGNPTMKKAFPSAPLKMKGPMSKASGDDEASDDSSVPKGLPLKGGISMGEKQAGLPGKGMPFMKKAPSFSMEKKSLGLPPLPLKGKGDGGGLKKGMGIPPLAKKSFGDADADTAAPMMKNFPSASLIPKGDALLPKKGNVPPTAVLSLKGKSSDDETSDLKLTKSIAKKPNSNKPKAKSIATDLQPATLLLSEGMTAEEAEKVRKNRLRTEEGKTSNAFDEKVQPAATATAITEGMTAEEAERARLARDTIAIDMSALQSRIRQLDPDPTATPQPTQKSTSTENDELKQLKETSARMGTKLESVLSQIDNLESKIEVLDKENLQLRRDNMELREELDDLKRSFALLDALSQVGQ